MKKIYTYLTIGLAASMLLGSCTYRELYDQDSAAEGLTLTVETASVSPVTTKSSEGHDNQTTQKNGDDDYNENLIRSVHYFLYNSNDLSEPVLKGSYDGINTTDKTVLSVAYTNDSEIEKLFGSSASSTCTAFVIVNLPSDVELTDYHLDSLKAKVVTTAWAGSNKEFVTPKEFIMSGQGTVKLTSRKNVVAGSGTIKAKRVASKITLQVCVDDKIYVYSSKFAQNDSIWTTETWVPMISGANIDGLKTYMVAATTEAMLDGSALESPDYFTYAQRSPIDSTSGTWTYYKKSVDSEGVYTTEVDHTDEVMFYEYEPFYSYPNEWKYGDSDEPYIKIICPWRRVATVTTEKKLANDTWITTVDESNTESQKQFYYKLAVPGNSFDNNNWYNYQVHLSILGAEADQAAVPVEYQYYVADWNDDHMTFNSSILDARYLSVDKSVIYLYNEESVSIPFITSHDCIITATDGTDNITHTKLDLSEKNFSSKTEKIDSRYSIEAVDNNIIYTKTLDNDITHGTTFDFTVDTVTFRVAHYDMPEVYYHDITIIQYPAMYASAATSNGVVYVNGYGGGNSEADAYDNYSNDIGSVVKASEVKNGSGDNNNINQYDIHVSVLPSSSNFVIGDPRQKYKPVSNLGDDVYYNYKAAGDSTGADVDNVIAPAFKIASSYGKTTALTYAHAKERCAAYQENGYPAGRWRLPTLAEVEYVKDLSKNGHIPTLFGDGKSTLKQYGRTYTYYVAYWAAGGYAYLGSSYTSTYLGLDELEGPYDFNNQSYTHNNTYISVYIRCVYDIWYWGEDPVEENATSWLGYYTK